MTKIRVFFLIFLLAFIGCIGAASIQKNSEVRAREIFVDSDGSKIFCRTIGKGKPLIVIHGGPGLTQDYLLPHLYKLAENNFVIFYDQRGCGQSTGAIHPDTLTMTALVNDLENIRKAFHFDKISLLGHSWGGFVAMHYAMAHPDLVDKLVLSNSIPASSDDVALFVSEWMQKTAPCQEELAAIQNREGFQDGNPALHEEFFRKLFRIYCHNPEPAELLDLQMTPAALIRYMKINAFFWETTLEKVFSLHSSLQTLCATTLIIHGDDDVVPSIAAKNIQASIPHSKYVEIKDCGHFPYVEQPEEYFNLLRDFLD